MLTLGRNAGEYLVINKNIIVQVMNDGVQIKLAVDAPKDVEILRGEVYERTNSTPECLVQLRKKEEKFF